MSGFHPAISTAILYFAMSNRSLQAVAAREGISKQAVAKRISLATAYFQAFSSTPVTDPRIKELSAALDRERQINTGLRRQLVICRTLLYLSEAFKEMALKFFPTLKLSRLTALQKKYLLDMLDRFQRLGGKVKEFCQAIDKSPDTLREWQLRYEKYGLSGLHDKKTRPKHFSNKLPLWLRQQLLSLFLRYPHWTPWQYHKHIAHNPAINWYVSIPTIQKLKDEHRERSEEERQRIKKRWCFDQSTEAWTVDFTTIHKNGNYVLRLLTVSDQRSRYLLDTALFLNASTEKVMDHLMELFLKHKRPFIIKVDNGPEFRTEFCKGLEELSIYLLSSPTYYGQFNGAHERIHRTLKSNISRFSEHQNLSRLVSEIEIARNDHNFTHRLEVLGMQTPATIFYGDGEFIPKDCQVVTPYLKDRELRMKFTGRDGQPARIVIPMIERAKQPDQQSMT